MLRKPYPAALSSAFHLLDHRESLPLTWHAAELPMHSDGLIDRLTRLIDPPHVQQNLGQRRQRLGLKQAQTSSRKVSDTRVTPPQRTSRSPAACKTSNR